MIFQKLFEQDRQFVSEEKIKDTVIANQLLEDKFKPEEEIVNNDEAGIDSVLYYITEDHDYQIPDDNPSQGCIFCWKVVTEGHHLKFLCGRYKEEMVEGKSFHEVLVQKV